MKNSIPTMATLATIVLSGCGTAVPDLKEFYEQPIVETTMVEKIVEHVECEVRTAVQAVILNDIADAAERRRHHLKQGRVLAWFDDWGANVTLTLTVDEKTTLNPGVALNSPLPTAVSTFTGSAPVMSAQSFTLGLGGTASADATRKDTLSLYLDFKKFTDARSMQEAAVAMAAGKLKEACVRKDGVLIQSDLKLDDWLKQATLAGGVEGGQITDFKGSLQNAAKVTKKDVISHEVTFVILYGGNVTPTWKLVRVSADQGSTPFFGVQRTKTQDLIVTFGPPQKDGLSVAAQNTILASQIGVAVANAIRSNQ